MILRRNKGGCRTASLFASLLFFRDSKSSGHST
jgi:hypothetical protein